MVILVPVLSVALLLAVVRLVQLTRLERGQWRMAERRVHGVRARLPRPLHATQAADNVSPA